MKNKSATYRTMAGALLVALLMVPQARADESQDSYRKLVYRWHQDRDDTVKRIVHSWLRGATPESLKKDVLQVISLDVRLANEDVELYIASLRDPNDLDMSVADLVHKYLSGIGVVTDSATFFRSRSFKVIREEPSAEGGKTSRKMALSKWGRK